MLSGRPKRQYSLASFRYDLSKLRAKGLVEKVPRSRRYRLLRKGYPICLVFLKLFEKIYAPLTAGLMAPLSGDPPWRKRNAASLTAYTNASATPWTYSCGKSVSRSPRDSSVTGTKFSSAPTSQIMRRRIYAIVSCVSEHWDLA
jgi:hypothetical protein